MAKGGRMEWVTIKEGGGGFKGFTNVNIAIPQRE